MDKISKSQRSNNMRAIRSKDTSIELMLRKELWRRGLRYRVNCKDVYGKPDILFVKAKVAIFCDGDFWHGKDYNENTFARSDNSEFWNNKIIRNMERDRIVDHELSKQGYKVLRFWESDIVKNLNDCCGIVIRVVNQE
ncbi:MAG: very short patch repair endonuclease [Firmicutes bacterium HGW-Firmicutes-10]|nr:MAG: very short patch repair endonuclease [Firmicutes bacterium HGW-Firmicutes-10]